MLPAVSGIRFNRCKRAADKEKILDMVAIMSPIIGIPEADMLKSMYIDTALSNCWTFNEYFPTQEAFENNRQEVLETCKFVYELMVLP